MAGRVEYGDFGLILRPGAPAFGRLPRAGDINAMGADLGRVVTHTNGGKKAANRGGRKRKGRYAEDVDTIQQQTTKRKKRSVGSNAISQAKSVHQSTPAPSTRTSRTRSTSKMTPDPKAMATRETTAETTVTTTVPTITPVPEIASASESAPLLESMSTANTDVIEEESTSTRGATASIETISAPQTASSLQVSEQESRHTPEPGRIESPFGVDDNTSTGSKPKAHRKKRTAKERFGWVQEEIDFLAQQLREAAESNITNGRVPWNTITKAQNEHFEGRVILAGSLCPRGEIYLANNADRTTKGDKVPKDYTYKPRTKSALMNQARLYDCLRAPVELIRAKNTSGSTLPETSPAPDDDDSDAAETPIVRKPSGIAESSAAAEASLLPEGPVISKTSTVPERPTIVEAQTVPATAATPQITAIPRRISTPQNPDLASSSSPAPRKASQPHTSHARPGAWVLPEIDFLEQLLQAAASSSKILKSMPWEQLMADHNAHFSGTTITAGTLLAPPKADSKSAATFKGTEQVDEDYVFRPRTKEAVRRQCQAFDRLREPLSRIKTKRKQALGASGGKSKKVKVEVEEGDDGNDEDED